MQAAKDGFYYNGAKYEEETSNEAEVSGADVVDETPRVDINAGNYEQSGSGSQEELGEGLVDDSLQTPHLGNNLPQSSTWKTNVWFYQNYEYFL